ncbi:MAG: hypothetical protein LBQ78_04490 [Tannerellaceae bacterium]|jgi:hypothetical protein|nr:hypothetical protein [Tannerellaceae bacterium]
MAKDKKASTKKEAASREEIISLAKQTQYYCDLLIEQSDQWLSPEEGNRIMAERIRKTDK